MTDGADPLRRTRIIELLRTRLWPLAVGLSVLAIVVVWSNRTGVWVGDNRFEQYENPGRRLARSLAIWDTSRGLGALRVDFWPGVTAPLGALRIFGVSRAATQHLWHAALIATGGIGTAAFLRLRLPRIGLAHVTAALLYMFGPYSVGFLLPSNLYLNYALAPWVFVLVVRGVQTTDPWQWAAVLALMVFTIGNTEAAGLIYAFLYLVPITVFLVHVERSTSWVRVIGFGARFGVLAVGVSAVTILTTPMGDEIFDQNLRETEGPTVLNGNSSWAESWRGLGNWLHYHIDSTGFARPQVITFLSDPLAITASFIPVVAAVAMVAFGRGRERVLFGSMMVFGLMMMVGLYPLRDPSPYGDLLIRAYDAFGSLQVLRNNYKAGSGAMLAIACLTGLATNTLWKWLQARSVGDTATARALSALSAVLGVLLLLGVTQPFWRGDLYPPERTLEAVPDYVYEAAAWIDDQPEAGRVLVLPRAYRSEFRWGWVNDDVLDAYIDRPHVVEVPIHLSRPVAADALTAIDGNLVNRLYEQGEIGPLARAIGVDFIMIRNDHVWESWDQPRPSAFDELRSDPAMMLVASFGRPGENTTAEADTSLQAEREQALPPIEIYAVDEPGQIVEVVAPAPEMLVSGGGAAFAQLASLGWLDATPGLRFTGRLDPAELTDALDAGSPLVITDTNRRRVETITISAQESRTLNEGEALEREPFELFAAEGAETVTDHGDAEHIRSSGPVAFGGGEVPWHRPANAFDGDPSTTWLVGGLLDPVGETLQVALEEPQLVSGVRLVAARPAAPNARRLTAATVSLSDGTVAAASLENGEYRLDFSPRLIESFTITVSATEGSGAGPVGLAEVDVLGVDAREWIEAPTDVARAAADHPPLAEALVAAPVAYAFDRAIGEGPVDEERSFRRRFVALRNDALGATGRLRLQPAASDALLHRIEPTEIRAGASNRLLGGLQFRAALMVDGRPDTGWVADPTGENRIELSFPSRPLRSLRIQARTGEGLSDITEAVIETVGASRTVTFERVQCDAPQCPAIAEAQLLGIPSVGATITITGIERAGQEGSQPIRIDEIELNGVPNEPAPDPAAGSAECITGLVQFDGRPLAIRLGAPRSLVLAGLPVPWVSCAPLEVAPGVHEFESLPAATVDTAVLAPVGFPAEVDAAAPSFSVIDQTPTSFAISVDAPDGGVVSIGQSWHPAWTATLDGTDLGPPIELDASAAWRLPPASSGLVEVEFAWQSRFDVALAITLVSLVICVRIVASRRVIST